MRHTITLTPEQLEAARAFAVRQEYANRKNRRRNAQGNRLTVEESLALRVSGFQGDAAFALFLGLPAERIADDWRSRPDVAGYDVTTTKRPDGRLIITPLDAWYVRKALVIDESPHFHICGWYLPMDAREHGEWWHEPRPGGGAWFVPQAFLHPFKFLEPLPEPERERLLGGSWREVLERAGAKPPNA